MIRTHRLAGARVLVAGAGLAGLAAARALEADGARVTIVEARDRVGGRVWTLRDGLHGQHAEAGGDIIDDDHAALLGLVRECGLRTVRTLKGGFAFYGLTPRGTSAVQSGRHTFSTIGRELAPLIRDYMLAEQRWNGAIAARLAAESVSAWMASRRLPRWLRDRITALRGLFLAEPDQLSLLALVDFLAGGQASGPRDGSRRIAGGNDRLATAVAMDLASPIGFGTTLRMIVQRGRRVVATLEIRGRLRHWSGDFAVVATPASTARDVQFVPALPEDQTRAMTRLKYGPATRVLLQFDRRFWRRKGRPSAFASARVHGAVWEANEEQRGPRGILTLLAGGDSSAEVSELIEREGIDGVVRRLQWLGRPANLLESRVVRWETDEWARGGYAFFDAGLEPRLREALARPAGRVVFAGEHTSVRWQGYMNGAVESGQRAAAEIAALSSSTRLRSSGSTRR